MNYLKLAIVCIVTTFAFSSSAQDLLDYLPETKEDFIESEENVLATINWLENTPANEQKEKHKEQYGYLVAWLTNSPTVTLELNASVLEFSKKNSELLIIFMGGWTKYVLENDYSKDAVKGTVAGLKSVIKVYNAGGLKKDKNVKKLIELEAAGELENWVKERI